MSLPSFSSRPSFLENRAVSSLVGTALEQEQWSLETLVNKDSGKIVVKDKTHACCKGTPNHWMFCSNKNIHITVITPLKGISKIASWWLRSRTLPEVIVFNVTVSTATCLLAKNAILLSKFYPPRDLSFQIQAWQHHKCTRFATAIFTLNRCVFIHWSSHTTVVIVKHVIKRKSKRRRN